MSTKNVGHFSPKQSRAARALLDLTQQELAKRAELGLSTIVDFEKSRRQVSGAAISSIKMALQVLGIQFIEENGGGIGVRLRHRSKR